MAPAGVSCAFGLDDDPSFGTVMSFGLHGGAAGATRRPGAPGAAAVRSGRRRAGAGAAKPAAPPVLTRLSFTTRACQRIKMRITLRAVRGLMRIARGPAVRSGADTWCAAGGDSRSRCGWPCGGIRGWMRIARTQQCVADQLHSVCLEAIHVTGRNVEPIPAPSLLGVTLPAKGPRALPRRIGGDNRLH